MGETPDHIREDIEETRARMGDTVEAIGYKADVKSRVKDSIVDKKDAVVGGADALVSRVSGAVPDRERVKSGARKVGVSKQNPLGRALAGAAAGFVAGTLLPSTDVEDERLGEVSDQVGEKAREAGQEALDRTKDVAREADRSGQERRRGTGNGFQPAGQGTGSRHELPELIRGIDGAERAALRAVITSASYPPPGRESPARPPTSRPHSSGRTSIPWRRARASSARTAHGPRHSCVASRERR